MVAPPLWLRSGPPPQQNKKIYGGPSRQKQKQDWLSLSSKFFVVNCTIRVVTPKVMCQGKKGRDSVHFVFVDENGEGMRVP
jgi:hypothetical protein